jgi:hypothetical protein
VQPLLVGLIVFLIYMSSSIFQICRASYSLTSTTSTLRNHLRRLHLAVYVAKCKEKGWTRYLQPQEIDGLASLQPRTPFSPDAFLEVLVRWIVADDQVRHFYTFSSKSHPCYPVYLRCRGSRVPQPSSLLAGRA